MGIGTYITTSKTKERKELRIRTKAKETITTQTTCFLSCVGTLRVHQVEARSRDRLHPIIVEEVVLTTTTVPEDKHKILEETTSKGTAI